MGGIGKTTLAKNVYKNLCIKETFDVRGWVTISQEYSVENVFSEILSCVKGENRKGLGESDLEIYKLGDELRKTLWGRRFLIVLDDVWTTQVWEKIKMFVPDNGNNSRVVITTRILNVSTDLSSSSFEMNFLDEDKSWELFCIEAFQGWGCPPELEVIGKKIVRECKGLPLSIALIGGLLRNSTRTLEYWENFARDINSPLMSGHDEHCLKVMNLSYNHLPAHLKPCFLYMGIYQEDERIYVPALIKTFVAEGFLKPSEVQSLEEVAGNYLHDLVDRNLVLADERRLNGRIKYCRMHDLVRDACLRMGEKADMFIYVMKWRNDVPPGIDRERRIVQYGTILKQQNMPSASVCRTFRLYGSKLHFKIRVLRVLTLVEPDSWK